MNRIKMLSALFFSCVFTQGVAQKLQKTHFYQVENGNTVLSTIDSFTYNGIHLNDTKIVTRPTNAGRELIFREAYVYGTNNKLRYIISLPVNGPIIDDTSFFELRTYDAQGRIDTQSTTRKTTNGWRNWQRAIYTYNAQGRLDSVFRFTGVLNVWLSFRNDQYVYLANGALDRVNWFSGASPSQMIHYIQYTYDAQGRLLKEENYRLNLTTGNYELDLRMNYAFQSSGKLDSIISEVFIGSTIEREKYVYDYNSFDSVATQTNYKEVNGQWNFFTKFEYFYFPNTTSASGLAELKSHIFPNPLQNELTIHIGEIQPLSASVRNLNGQELKRFILPPGQSSIDLQDLPSGMYLLHLQAGGKSAVHKLVKQ
ncbi:MAG: hypothetical protein C0424_07270 [Sphingobacteriaceae bacterium]|nr:hypothetical protein [Sphingobacteriaceae bacterium]